MASAVTLKTVGNWDKQVGVPLSDALSVSMEIMGRTGQEACKHALILMAQSARALTKQSKPRRKVQKDNHGKYVEAYTQASREPRKIYEWMFSDANPKRRRGTWEKAQVIGRRGLAKQSWMWGLNSSGKTSKGKIIKDISYVYSITSQTANGYVMDNKLSYVVAVMPSGWERTVELRAGNRIMKQASMKLQQQWRTQMGLPRGHKISRPNVSQFFLRGMAE